MYTINPLVALALFQTLWISLVQSYAASPADPTITPAPEANFLLQARQASSETVTCSNWTIPGVGNPLCPSASSCYHMRATTGYAGCFYSLADAVPFSTACHDYPASWPGAASPSFELYCSATAPSCGSIIFVNAPGRWTQYICDATADLYTAFYTSLPGSTSGLVVPTTSAESSSYPSSTSDTSSGSSTPDPAPAPQSSSHAAVIGGAVVGVVGGIGLIIGALIVFFCMRRRNRRRMQPQGAGIAVGHAAPEYKSPNAFQPPAEYQAPPAANKNTAIVSEHC